jgi:hypothetical protein
VDAAEGSGSTGDGEFSPASLSSNLGVAMRESQPDGRHGILRALGAAMVAMCLGATTLTAQIRGRPATRQPDAGWWISGGAAAVILNDISDGATRSKWTFGSDPLWQMRGTIERALDEATTLGVSAGYGVVNLALTPMTYTAATRRRSCGRSWASSAAAAAAAFTRCSRLPAASPASVTCAFAPTAPA